MAALSSILASREQSRHPVNSTSAGIAKIAANERSKHGVWNRFNFVRSIGELPLESVPDTVRTGNAARGAILAAT